MTVAIPTSTEHAHYEQVTQVDGRNLRFAFDWNGRLSRWKVSIYEGDSGDAIALGLTVVDGWPLTLRSRDARLPRGTFMALDPSGSGIDPAFAELGQRSVLLFVPEDDG